MSGLSKRAANELIQNIRRAKITSVKLLPDNGGDILKVLAMRQAAFLGGMESVLQHFLYQEGLNEAAAALHSAMNDEPTDAEKASHRQLFGQKA